MPKNTVRGPYVRHKPLLDLTGRVFGAFLVLSEAERREYASGARIRFWRCRCIHCGSITERPHSDLVGLRNRSCGCIRYVLSGKHQMSHSPEYRTWINMIRRCKPNRICRETKYHSQRGIRVCKSWLNCFDKFLQDMGPKPSPLHSLDRINNNGAYSPSNCRWALPRTQANNTRGNHLVTYHGKTMSISNWAVAIGLKPNTLRNRIHRGWIISRALTEPVRL
jgi:hypothetical protein